MCGSNFYERYSLTYLPGNQEKTYNLVNQNTKFNEGNYQKDYSRETTFQGRKLFAEIRYVLKMIKSRSFMKPLLFLMLAGTFLRK